MPKNTALTVDGVIISYQDNLPIINITYKSTNQSEKPCFQNMPIRGTYYISSNCSVAGYAAPPGDVEISNSATVTINNGARLDMYFDGSKLLITNGSSIVVKDGGIIN